MAEKLKIGINGFGRIGRAILRVNRELDLFDVVVINDLNGDIENLVYQLKYDSLHGILNDEVTKLENNIVIGSDHVKVFNEVNIENIPWDIFGVNLIIDCTGSLENVDNAKKCIKNSVKKVFFSDSPQNVDLTVVLGVNDTEYDSSNHDVISCSICDVVGSAPAIKIINDEFGIKSGFLQTLHPWLSYQNLMDSKPNSIAFKDKPWTFHAIGRASIGALIPKDTSVVSALERVIPELKGKLSGMSYRVPTEIVASANLTVELDKKTDAQTIKQLLKEKMQLPYLQYIEDPLISVDYKHNPNACIVDGKWIEVMDNHLLRMVTWYDNEWGYSNHLLNLINYIANGVK